MSCLAAATNRNPVSGSAALFSRGCSWLGPLGVPLIDLASTWRRAASSMADDGRQRLRGQRAAPAADLGRPSPWGPGAPGGILRAWAGDTLLVKESRAGEYWHGVGGRLVTTALSAACGWLLVKGHLLC